MWGSESCTTIIIFPFGHLSDRERTATGREHNPHTTEPSIDCQHRKCGFLLSRSKRQTSFLLLSVADRIVGNRAREQYSDCYLLSERRSRWPGRSAGCRPVPSNRARQKARQPASPRRVLEVRTQSPPAERCYGAGGEDGNFVAYINRWSAAMPQPND